MLCFGFFNTKLACCIYIYMIDRGLAYIKIDHVIIWKGGGVTTPVTPL